MRANKLLDDKYKKDVAKRAKEKVEKEIKIYENLKDPDPESMMKYTYEEMTENLKEQFDEFTLWEFMCEYCATQPEERDYKDLLDALDKMNLTHARLEELFAGIMSQEVEISPLRV